MIKCKIFILHASINYKLESVGKTQRKIFP
jgi:hypothetical protein